MLVTTTLTPTVEALSIIGGEAPPFILLGVAIGMIGLVFNGLGHLRQAPSKLINVFGVGQYHVTMAALGAIVISCVFGDTRRSGLQNTAG